jgi:hypothetical protein
MHLGLEVLMAVKMSIMVFRSTTCALKMDITVCCSEMVTIDSECWFNDSAAIKTWILFNLQK